MMPVLLALLPTSAQATTNLCSGPLNLPSVNALCACLKDNKRETTPEAYLENWVHPEYDGQNRLTWLNPTDTCFAAAPLVNNLPLIPTAYRGEAFDSLSSLAVLKGCNPVGVTPPPNTSPIRHPVYTHTGPNSWPFQVTSQSLLESMQSDCMQYARLPSFDFTKFAWLVTDTIGTPVVYVEGNVDVELIAVWESEAGMTLVWEDETVWYALGPFDLDHPIPQPLEE